MTVPSTAGHAERVLTADTAPAREMDTRAAAWEADRRLVAGAGRGDIADAWRALAEARRERAEGRRSFLRNAFAGLAAGGAAAAAGFYPAGAAAQSSAGSSGTNAGGPVAGDREQFQDIRRNENDHRLRVEIILGQFARPKPTFVDLTQPDFGSFFSYSYAFENIGAGANAAAAPFVTNPEVLSLLGPIALIEGRQAGWLQARAGRVNSTNVFGQDQSFEQPLFPEDVVFLIGRLIVNLNGGPPVTYARQRGGVQNDLQILNFVLALEQLETEFYNINVPRFFGS